MKKKFLAFGAAFIMLFSLIVFGISGCELPNPGGDPNRGSIEGFEDGYFVAHHDKGFVFRQDIWSWYLGYRYETKLINSRNELVEWARPFLETRQEWNSDSQRWETIHIELYDEDIFAEYCDEFFELHQLVFICFDGGHLGHEVERISYQDNVLKIEFIRIRVEGTINPRPLRRYTAIVEITRICEDLGVEFSRRER